MVRLTYWNKRGRGEQVRLLLNELEEPYEDVHVAKGDEFRALQDRGPSVLPFGSIPLLEDGDFRLVQGPVILGYLARKHDMLPDDLKTQARADAIALGAEDLRMQYFQLFGPEAEAKQRSFLEGRWSQRWLPRLDELLETEGSGFFVGKRISHGDIAMWDALDAMTTWVEGATLEEHAHLKKFYEHIKARPPIAKYLASDRRPQS